MPRPYTIQIAIPEPCTQPWDEMSPSANGRFCAHCQRTVIDFSTWTDAALYDFFSKPKGSVCGRFRTSQLGRQIHIPPQPHSQLYRMVIALGLTLIFTQGTLYAQSTAPLVPVIQVNAKDSIKTESNSGVVFTDSITTPIASTIRPEIYSMGALPPNIAVIPKIWVTDPIYTFTMPVNTKLPLPKQIKNIRIPKLPGK